MDSAVRLMPMVKFLMLVEGRESDDHLEMTPIEAEYRQSARLLASGKPAPALDGLLDVLRQNKEYKQGKAKEVLLSIFEFLGNADPLTGAYRRELASLLYYFSFP
jgi:putative thioredoxin